MIGSDPECFLRDRSGNLVSSIGLIPGSKMNPHKTPHGSIQPDNISAEFNSRPASTLAEFIENHRLIIKDLEDVIKPLDLHLDFIGSVMAPEALLSEPAAQQAGCEPDYDAWNLCVNEKANYALSNLRAAGGHLHISFDQAVDQPMNRIKFIRALDLVLGVPSVLLDSDNERRRIYGKAGSFRPKDTLIAIPDPYDGVEYRTLSNFWLKSEELMAWAWRGVERVYHNLEGFSELAEEWKDDIIHTINSGDKDKAEYLCNHLGVEYA